MLSSILTTKHTRKAQGSLEFCAFLLSLNTDHFQHLVCHAEVRKHHIIFMRLLVPRSDKLYVDFLATDSQIKWIILKTETETDN
jgi:hypothetical protein